MPGLVPGIHVLAMTIESLRGLEINSMNAT
jgi:hypothetical protein